MKKKILTILLSSAMIFSMGISTVSAAAADDTASTESIVVSKTEGITDTTYGKSFVVLLTTELIPSVEFLVQKRTDLKCQRLRIPGRHPQLSCLWFNRSYYKNDRSGWRRFL